VNLYPGVYRGVVEDVNDPQKRGRVRVRCFHVHPDAVPAKHLPWAEVVAYGGDDFGDVPFYQPGDRVLVLFEGGDREYPFVAGGWLTYAAASDNSDLLPEQQESYPSEGILRWIRKDRQRNRLEFHAIEEARRAKMASGESYVELQDDGEQVIVHSPGLVQTDSASLSMYASSTAEMGAQSVLLGRATGLAGDELTATTVSMVGLTIQVGEDGTEQVGVNGENLVIAVGELQATVSGPTDLTLSDSVSISSGAVGWSSVAFEVDAASTLALSAATASVTATTSLTIDAPVVDITDRFWVRVVSNDEGGAYTVQPVASPGGSDEGSTRSAVEANGEDTVRAGTFARAWTNPAGGVVFLYERGGLVESDPLDGHPGPLVDIGPEGNSGKLRGDETWTIVEVGGEQTVRHAVVRHGGPGREIYPYGNTLGINPENDRFDPVYRPIASVSVNPDPFGASLSIVQNLGLHDFHGHHVREFAEQVPLEAEGLGSLRHAKIVEVADTQGNEWSRTSGLGLGNLSSTYNSMLPPVALCVLTDAGGDTLEPETYVQVVLNTDIQRVTAAGMYPFLGQRVIYAPSDGDEVLPISSVPWTIIDPENPLVLHGYRVWPPNRSPIQWAKNLTGTTKVFTATRNEYTTLEDEGVFPKYGAYRFWSDSTGRVIKNPVTGETLGVDTEEGTGLVVVLNEDPLARTGVVAPDLVGFVWESSDLPNGEGINGYRVWPPNDRLRFGVFKLIPCPNNTDTDILFTTLTTFSQWVNRVVKLTGMENSGCWTVTEAALSDATQPPSNGLYPQEVLDDCCECSKVKDVVLERCSDQQVSTITVEDTTGSFLAVGDIIRIDDVCYEITSLEECSLETASYTIDNGDVFSTCSQCDGETYLMTDCENADVTENAKITNVAVGDVIQYLNTCWELSAQPEQGDEIIIHDPAVLNDCEECLDSGGWCLSCPDDVVVARYLYTVEDPASTEEEAVIKAIEKANEVCGDRGIKMCNCKTWLDEGDNWNAAICYTCCCDEGEARHETVDFSSSEALTLDADTCEIVAVTEYECRKSANDCPNSSEDCL